jgi:hypothetical protein
MVLARLTDYIRERWEFRQQLIVGALSLLIGSEHASCKFMPRWLWWEEGRRVATKLQCLHPRQKLPYTTAKA